MDDSDSSPETISSHKTPFSLSVIIAMDLLHSLLFFFTLVLCSSLTATQPPYFINCGSADNATLSDGRTFVGDVKSRQFKFSGDRSKTVVNSNQSGEPLYQKARVFRIPSTYQFQVPEIGTYILRLHFYPFSSSPELANAQFNVSASGHLLLSDFSVPKNGSDPIKEFILSLKQNPNLRLRFWPRSIAFVNAIEVMATSQNITEDNGPYVSPEGGSRGVYKGQKSKVLETIYRINVGASDKKPYVDGDTDLWRTWFPDDPYLITKDEAKNAPYYSTGVSRAPGLATTYDAPDYVYVTAKMLMSTKSDVSSNLTWQFRVSTGARYFVRAHFCDIISPQLSPYMFNIYFYTKFEQKIYPFSMAAKLAVPFYRDFIVESNDLEFVNVSIGSSGDSIDKSYMFLNGLEILQIKEGVAPDPGVDGGVSFHLGLLVGSVIGGVCIVAVLVGVLFVLRRRRKRTKPAELFEWGMGPLNVVLRSENWTPNTSPSRVSSLSNLQLGLKIPFFEIQQVTNNFDPSLIIGEGGFGKVYKGTLKNGIEVAVKRSNPDHGQGLAEFQTEIMVLSKIRHYHLVSLIGYCYESGEMILVYEFMEKGSLRDHLCESSVKSSSSSLSWKQRLEICIGAAKGLQYLHTGLDNGIIHRDVKSTNILLDQKYVAKVADFGLSRSQHLEKTHVSTEVKGTFGYLDPEYFSCLQLTEKSDVYSFGVVLLEVLCARPVIDRSLPRVQINLVDWAITCQKEGNLESIIDPSIASEISPNSLKKFVETVEKCLKESAVERPPMADVLWDLEYALQLQKMAELRNLPDDSMTDASVSLPFPVARRLPSMSFADDDEEENVLIDMHTGEVFSQFSFERDGLR